MCFTEYVVCFSSCEQSGCLRKRRLQLPGLNQWSCSFIGSRWPVYWNILSPWDACCVFVVLYLLTFCRCFHCFCCEALPLRTPERSGCRQKHTLHESPFDGRLPVYNQYMLLSMSACWPVCWNITTELLLLLLCVCVCVCLKKSKE